MTNQPEMFPCAQRYSINAKFLPATDRLQRLFQPGQVGLPLMFRFNPVWQDGTLEMNAIGNAGQTDTMRFRNQSKQVPVAVEAPRTTALDNFKT
jgi:hypothetical protein